ncbi:MAG: TRAP transporter large permease, partial [Planctomycetes bacterium]|nr:TRAP transporter large permease [Planctomycetota bacterium]
EAGLADRIIRFSHALVGRIKGGMILVVLVATLILSALTGSSVPCVAALVPLLVPRLEKYGYHKVYSTAIICASSFSGYLIPPSVPALLYCMVAQQSIAAVFLATVFPGLLLLIGYGVLNHFICHKFMFKAENAAPVEKKESWGAEMLKSTWNALPALGAPLVILIGIYGGFFTPNEAGAVGAVYCIAIGLFFYRDLDGKNFWKSVRSTSMTMGLICLLLGGGTVFTRLLIQEGVAQSFAETMLGLFQSKYMIMLALNALLLFLGMFIDAIPILILAVPLVLPLVTRLEVNLVHLGAIVIFNVGLGVITPPYAMSLFVGSRLSGVHYTKLIKPMLHFLFLVGIPVLMLTTYIPALSCWLPTLLLGEMVVGKW